MNRYGCRPFPRAAVSFGSCTASSPLPEVYEAAADLHLRLQMAVRQNTFDEQLEAAYSEIVASIRHQLDLDGVPGVNIALTPSGTDAEYLATLLSLGDQRHDITNIVVGPREVGSGSELAAEGKHFDDFAPTGIPACRAPR